MSARSVYLLLCVVGLVLPYAELVPWLLAHGFDLPGFGSQLFANRISAFFGLDVIVSAVALLVFVLVEGKRQGLRHLAWPVAGTLLVGVSFGLPLFLYMRERGRAERPVHRSADRRGY
jgi:hypothetical protein